jgi:hypothetical protein
MLSKDNAFKLSKSQRFKILQKLKVLAFQKVNVPNSKSRNIPEVVLARRWAVGILGIWRGGVGWVKGGATGVSLQATRDWGGRS